MSTPWIHSFSVTDTQLYEGKFTIYRITSVIFPINNPAALSCVFSWKRFSDVKELHQTLSKGIKRERLRIKLPTYKSKFFHRFHPKVIDERRKWILEFLDAIGAQANLYSCDAFMKFLQTGYTPSVDSVDGVKYNGELLTAVDRWRCESDASEDRSSSSMAEDQISIATTTSSQAAVISGGTAAGDDKSQSQQPRFSGDYIVEASERFNEAVQLEVNDRYAEALATYKDGIEVLMTGIRGDTDHTRRRVAKEKVEKYLARSENIYEHFIRTPSEGTGAFDPTMITSRGATRELPLNHLSKYKVLRILDDNVMSVQEVTTRRFFIIKSIDRTEDWNGLQVDMDMAYMVHLVAYFVAECVVFLLLQPASGGRLMDYIASFEPSAAEPLEDDAVPVIVPEESCPGAPAYDTMSPQVDIEELLLSSQLLLNSVQKTLDGETDTPAISKPSTEVDVPSSRSRCIPEACVRQWAKELIVAVDALHAKNITLGHLSAQNLLLGKNGQLLITYYHFQDFSDAISKHSCTEDSFLAPERPTSRSSDWYSVGVVLYELLTGHPFQDHHPGRWCYFELQFPDTVRLTSAATSLLDGLLAENPETRLGFTDICAHAFFNEADALSSNHKHHHPERTVCVYYS